MVVVIQIVVFWFTVPGSLVLGCLKNIQLPSLGLKMEMVLPSYQSVHCHNPEDHHTKDLITRVCQKINLHGM
jgi:hypothetical protein